MQNTEWKWVYGSLIVAAVFIITGIVAITSMECMDGGCALAFLSVVLVITMGVTAVVFFFRALAADAIFSGKDLLAHWTYSAEETKKSAEREYAGNRVINHGLFTLIGVMLVIAIVLLLVFGGDGGPVTAVFLLVFLVVLFAISRITPGLERGRALAAPKEAYIAKNGVIYEGASYLFVSFMMRRYRVTLREESGESPALLVFSFVQLVGVIPKTFEIAVPVPAGEMEKAREIARYFSGQEQA
jgi:hypothetical protein